MAARDGKLFVLVMEARNVNGSRWVGHENPYCKIYLDKTKAFKTQIIEHSTEPKWEEKARQLPISASASPTIVKLALWDSKLLGKSRIGEFQYSMKDLYDGVPRDEWFTLTKSGNPTDKPVGELRVRLLFLDPDDEMTQKYDEFPYPLQTLLRKKRFEAFRGCLQAGKDIEQVDKDGNRPIHVAGILDQPEGAKLLLEKGADINAPDTERGALPIHKAAEFSASVLKLLIDTKKVDVNAKDSKGLRPLHYSAKGNNTKALSLLLEHGADINAPDSDGQTPLHRALQEKESTEAIKMLVEKGCDIYAVDKNDVSCAKLCTDERKVLERTKKEFMKAVGIIDTREFPLRKEFPNFRKTIVGDNLSNEWSQNYQFAILPSPGATKIQILMHYEHQDKNASQMEKCGFMVVTSDEGVHKEPSYKQDLIGYGTIDPFTIVVNKDKDVTSEKGKDKLLEEHQIQLQAKQKYYIVMPYGRTADAKGYYDLIFYSDAHCDVTQLVNWKHTISVQGEWSAEKSGGCKENEAWLEQNPLFKLTLPNDHQKVVMTVMLAQAKAALDLMPFNVTPYQFYIGYYILDKDMFEIVAECEKWKNAQETYVHLAIDTSKDNQFIIVPTTHKPSQLTSFTLTVLSDVPVMLEPYTKS